MARAPKMADEGGGKTYTAPHPVYQGGRLVPAGEPFTTASPKGQGWEEVSPAPDAS
nr:hypothetical protein [Sphingomonas sp. SCN 67-18]